MEPNDKHESDRDPNGPCEACALTIELFEPLSRAELIRAAELLEEFAGYTPYGAVGSEERYERENIAAGLRGAAATMCSGRDDHGV